MKRRLPGRNRSDDVRPNPIESARQYGLMQAIASGKSYVKGISQALAEEMIERTPKGLRSKFAKELAKHRRNPEEDEVIAAELSENWHGRKARETTTVEEVEKYDTVLVELGELEVLGVLGSDNYTQNEISFKRDRPKMTGNLESNFIEFVGGDQELEFEDDFELDKKLIPIGYSYSIVYETDKHHLEGSNGYPESYEHFWGEEFYKEQGYDQSDFKSADDFFQTVLEEGVVDEAREEGYLPMVVYDTVNKKISLVGGRYRIEDVGIVN